MLHAAGVIVGLLLGLVATKLADVLPGRYDITHLVTGAKRTRRNVVVVALVIACCVGIAHVLSGITALSLVHAVLLLAFHGTVAMMIICASAIDLEHMILPNELTLGGAVLCVATAPLRSIGIVDSAIGAVTGFVIAYVPFWIYKRLRGRSGMGLGDAMFAVLAGAWFGPLGAVLVLFGGAFLMPLATVILRILRIAGHPVRQRVDVAGMHIDEHSKRVAVAVAGPGDNRRVALVHPCCLDGLRRIRLALDGHDSGVLKGGL